MADGWIKLYRSALDTPELQTAVRRGVWSYLLLKAAHKPTGVVFRGRPTKIDRGQLAVSVNAMAREQEIGRKQLRNILSDFQAAKMIKMDQVRGQPFSLITINKFNEFQQREATEGPSQGPSEGQVGANSGPREQECKNVRRKESDSKHRLNGDAEVRKREQAAFRQALDREFLETFWPAYPAKVAKPAAKKAYHRARGTHPLDVIMRGLEAYKRTKPPERSWMHPATFLNQERFNDEHGSDRAAAEQRQRGQLDYESMGRRIVERRQRRYN